MVEKMTEPQRYLIVDFIKKYGKKKGIETTAINAFVLMEGFIPDAAKGSMFVSVQLFARKNGFRAHKQPKPPKKVIGKRMISFELEVETIEEMSEAIIIETKKRKKKVTQTAFLTDALENHIKITKANAPPKIL